MSTILIRRLDESVKTRLRRRATRHGRSMEEEAREILKAALAGPAKTTDNLFERIHARFAALGGFELPQLPREPMREPPIFE